MRQPVEGVWQDPRTGKRYVVLVLDSVEAENVAYSLGLQDKGAEDILKWVAEIADAEDFEESEQ